MKVVTYMNIQTLPTTYLNKTKLNWKVSGSTKDYSFNLSVIFYY